MQILTRGQKAAIAWLAKQRNYRIIRSEDVVILEHYGRYGYSCGGSYHMWKTICTGRLG